MAENDRTFAVGAMMLVAGGMIGAGLALLFAPQSGKKTRRQLVRYGAKVRNETEEMLRETADAVADAVETLGEKTSDLMEKGQDVAEDWRKHMLQTLDQGQKSLERQKKKLIQFWG